jgi:SAM-dependent methyltransferase
VVLAVRPGSEHFDVVDDEHDFYGRTYWTEYATARSFPDIGERARSDLSERCAFWIERLLEVVDPPGRTLEIGCGHGGFVRLLQELGFDAVGTELSPWVVQFAKETFDVPVLLGRLETLPLERGFRCIAAFDVLEHLSDPLETMRRCGELLADDGVLLLQTPCYRGEGPEWRMFQPDEHIYLFTESAVRLLLRRAGFEAIAVEESLFPHDMWVVARLKDAASAPRPRASPARIPAAFQAVLDLRRQSVELNRTVAIVDADRAERLAQVDRLTNGIHDLARRLDSSDADRAARLEQIRELTGQIHELTRRLVTSDADRAARLEQIPELTRRLTASEADRASRLEQIEELTRRLTASEADRAARLEQIEELTRRLTTSEADRASRLEQIEELTRRLATTLDADRVGELKRQLATSEAEGASRLEEMEELVDRLATSEADRAARLEQIEELARRLATSEADRAARLEQIHELTRRLETSEADRAARLNVIDAQQAELDTIRRSKVWRMYRAIHPGDRSRERPTP